MIGKQVWSLTPAKIILGGFFLIIITGAVLLTLPFASKTGEATPFIDAVFTATSATCVTGLIVHDTYTYWSVFGQAVIIILIQIGGMGVVTLAIAITILSGKKIGLKQRYVMQESISAPQVGGIVRMTSFIVKGTIFFEAAGAVIMAFQFCPQMGLIKGIWFSVFHSISAFCNAGFDLMGGTSGPTTSITSYTGNPLINIPIMLLIIIGGIGFFVWDDVKTHKLQHKYYHLQTKIVLTTTFCLIMFPALFLFLFEFSRDCWDGLSLQERFMASLFQSVTTRTAGFCTIPQGELKDSSTLLTLVLMFVGGSPAGTAGGVKTTTVAMILMSVMCFVKGKRDTEMFGRRVPADNVRTGLAVLTISLLVVFTNIMLLLLTDGAEFRDTIFEVVTAIGTVGLSRGLTPDLTFWGKLIIIVTMYIGRIGPITMVLAFGVRRQTKGDNRELPEKRILVG